MSLGESVMVYCKNPCPRLTFLYLPWLPSPTGLGNRAPVPFVMHGFACGVGDVALNVWNNIGGTRDVKCIMTPCQNDITDPL